MVKLALRKQRLVLVVALLLASSNPVQAQTLTTLLNFGKNNGTQPAASLLQGPDGNLYGTSSSTIFRVTPSGTLTTLYTFGLYEGGPVSALTLGTDANFYGTAEYGAGSGGGTIFRITPSGTFTTVYTLGGVDDAALAAALTVGPDGNFYGTTSGDPSSCSGNGSPMSGCGTVFRITPSGAFTTLHSFGGSNIAGASADGANPVSALTLAPDGNFYGTTQHGGPLNAGTIFRITPTGTLATLHFFNRSDGALPMAVLTLGPDGNFYGTAENGGNLNCVTGGCGTVFKMSPAGVFNTLYVFGGPDGSSPYGALTLAADGIFYGTTRAGGPGKCAAPANGCGTVFKITMDGAVTTLYSFSGADGANPVAALTLASDGNLYGTTQLGGANSAGTFFTINVSNTRLSLNANGVVNAASFSTPVAPGSIASAFGTFLIPNPIYSNTLPIATSLSGLSVQFGTATFAPLFFASQSQVNLQIPWELAGQAQTTVSVTQDGQYSAVRVVPLATYAPGIFVVDGQTAQGAILDEGYHLVGPGNPATPGAIVQIYCTGLGPVTSPPATGATSLSNPLSWTTITPTVSIGGVTATVLFSGLVPGNVGLYQVNVQVPSNTAKKAVPVSISLGGVTSNAVTLSVP